ncbi:prefoldin subunit 3 isoform X1 [Orcinus orca]|uniref:Prefoldin subunit 3 n=1 Tax=Tursiops truncatus TaxID=9739 RepID=A0A2U4BIJ9_TURTR|nr:prefoldin subunit 3 isoform X1 [Tursiops truncatus]XP_026955454.1 prefoldin subunit 3 isoform X1 [Lagenorhynchus obliquidens]XP_030706064.1 prefoldin subunit 3 isoform X1 [Globicephala melas]XP_033272732.1 prefoldin subunit 3 isoform X1 [Orcinus orca]XP_060148683.1 prefoldin subunit 3 isoform X1 [Globicephala melas]
MAAGKEGCVLGEVAGGNGRRLHLGIPEAVFVEDVDSFMKQPGNETADTVLKKLDEQYQKYKFMELNLAQKKRRLKGQIPEIKQTLEILKYMQKKKESTNSLETRFLLADNLYCKASVPPTDKVCLWLGANVMLEYDIDEAQALLEKNLSTATKNLDSLEEDLDFLRDQFTTTEVNIFIASQVVYLLRVSCVPATVLSCMGHGLVRGSVQNKKSGEVLLCYNCTCEPAE